MTSAKSPDRDSTRAPDRIRPTLGKLRAPLALSPAASPLCFRPLADCVRRSLHLSDLLVPFLSRLTRGCTPLCRVSRMDARTSADGGRAARPRSSRPRHDTVTCLSSVYAHLFTLASTVSRPHLRPPRKFSSPPAPAPMPMSATPHRLPGVTTRTSPALLYSSMNVRYPAILSFTAHKASALPLWPCLLP
jgi:hypothetical protein